MCELDALSRAGIRDLELRSRLLELAQAHLAAGISVTVEDLVVFVYRMGRDARDVTKRMDRFEGPRSENDGLSGEPARFVAIEAGTPRSVF